MNTTPERDTEADFVEKIEDVFKTKTVTPIELDEAIGHGYETPIADKP